MHPEINIAWLSFFETYSKRFPVVDYLFSTMFIDICYVGTICEHRQTQKYTILLKSTSVYGKQMPRLVLSSGIFVSPHDTTIWIADISNQAISTKPRHIDGLCWQRVIHDQTNMLPIESWNETMSKRFAVMDLPKMGPIFIARIVLFPLITFRYWISLLWTCSLLLEQKRQDKKS